MVIGLSMLNEITERVLDYVKCIKVITKIYQQITTLLGKYKLSTVIRNGKLEQHFMDLIGLLKV